MSDLIDRQAAIDALNGEITVTGRSNAEAVKSYGRLIVDRIRCLPSAEPVRRGKWMKCDEDKWEHIYALRCSECHGGYHLSHETTTAWDYCPNCGADMRDEEEWTK